MTQLKNAALALIEQLRINDVLDYADYCLLFDALDVIETVSDRDSEIEALWQALSDVPMNPETEKMEAPFLAFPAGTDREEIWRWFDKRHSKGVGYLLCGGADL